jgi:hypothetical protein
VGLGDSGLTLVEADGDRVLGFTAFGVGTGEIMAGVQIAMILPIPRCATPSSLTAHSRRGSSQAIAVVDLMNYKTGLEDNHMGNHGIVGRIGVLSDVQIS